MPEPVCDTSGVFVRVRAALSPAEIALPAAPRSQPLPEAPLLELAECRVHQPLRAAAFAPNGMHAAALDTTVEIRDERGTALGAIGLRSHSLHFFDYRGSLFLAAAAGNDLHVMRIDPASGAVVSGRRYDLKAGHVEAMTSNAKGDLLCLACRGWTGGSQVDVIGRPYSENAELFQNVYGTRQRITALAMPQHHHFRSLAVAESDGVLRVLWLDGHFDPQVRETLLNYSLPAANSHATALAFRSRGEIIIGDNQGHVEVLAFGDGAAQSRSTTRRAPKSFRSAIRAVKALGDGGIEACHGLGCPAKA